MRKNNTGNKVKIMIVDDSVLMRNAIAMIVESQPDFEVVERAFNGQDALDKLKKIPRPLQPDVILVDIEMPEMDGLTFLRHAKMRINSKLIILSSKVLDKASAEHKQASLNGASAIISKPSGAVSFDIEQKRSHEIIQTIRTVLKK